MLLILFRLFLPCGPLNFAYNNYTWNITQTFVEISIMLQQQKTCGSNSYFTKITALKILKLIISNPKTVFAIPMSLVHLMYTTLWKALAIIPEGLKRQFFFLHLFILQLERDLTFCKLKKIYRFWLANDESVNAL